MAYVSTPVNQMPWCNVAHCRCLVRAECRQVVGAASAVRA